MNKILLIEDDSDMVGLLSYHLKDQAFDLEFERNGKKGFDRAMTQKHDLIILDVNLPDKNGLDICRDLRSNKKRIPIMMLTARTDEIDRVLGLELGADDYICKPFSIRELIARIRAVIRRAEANSIVETKVDTVKMISLRDLSINVETRTVRRNNITMKLTPTEFDLLVLLASNPGKTFTKELLLSKVWGYDFDGFKHTVSSHVNRLRGKIEITPNDPSYVLTTWGVGYRFSDK